MELRPHWASFLVVVLATVLFLKVKAVLLGRHRKCYNLPPGPKPWPIIGNLNLIGALPHRSLHALSKQYGPLTQLQFGSFPVVAGSSVEMAKFFLKTQDLVFGDRPKTAAGKYTTYNCRDIVWTTYGAYGRQARKMCATELFSARRLESYEYIRREEVLALLNSLRQASGRAVVLKLKDYLSTATMNVSTRMVMGNKYLEKEVRDQAGSVIMTPQQFKWMVDELFLLNGVLNIGDSIPWLDWLDLQGYIKRMKKLGRMFDRFLEHVLDEHTHQKRESKDMVDVLLEFAGDPDLEVRFDRECVKAFTQDLIAGGTESAAVTLEWALSELLRKPEVLAKATEELDRVVGPGRWVMEKDIPSLPYVDAVVKETMRLHPVAPMLAPRVSREDTSVAGYDIPTGTRVLVNVWSIGRDPELWDAPEEFMPERFLGSKIDVKGHDYQLLPFGAGRRMCPGYSLGLKIIQVGLANLLHGFAWSLPDGVTKEEMSMEEVFGLSVTRKVPLEAIVEPKLQAHLYAEA